MSQNDIVLIKKGYIGKSVLPKQLIKVGETLILESFVNGKWIELSRCGDCYLSRVFYINQFLEIIKKGE